MFGYNHPNLKELLGYPYLAWVIALATVRLAPEGAWRELATFGYYAVCINVAIVPSIYLVKQFVDYEKGEDDPAPISQPVKTYLDMNKADERGNVYAQATDNLKVNAVMAFNKTLIEQYQGGLEVNLTEAFWLNKQPGADESRWTKAGGSGRSDFVEFIERGILWKAYKKVGGQGKRVPDNWRKIAQLAQGYPLPRFEQLPKQ